jgi:hexosaminidase
MKFDPTFQTTPRFLSSLLLTLTFVWSTTLVCAQGISIIPEPVQWQRSNGNFTITNSTTVGVPARQAEVMKVANYLTARLNAATGFGVKTVESGGTIQLRLNAKPAPTLGQEGYQLDVTASGIIISANSAAGLFYGVQSLIQLLPKEIESKTVVSGINWTVPVVTITDYPRFGWRGIMLDVSRHFFPKEFVKDYIDQLARYKYNRFHWHLTDDNGWRVEIKSYPKLTEVGAWRVPRTGTFGSNTPPRPGEAPTYGGFYTQDDIREVVQYAKDRFIEILPEIDVPGHSMAAIAAYPELCVTKDATIQVNPGTAFSKWYGGGKFDMFIDNTLNPTDENVYQFLDKVLGELATLFPFEYIHMGGDECYKGYWERDANVQAFMKKNNIKNGDELQAYFNNRVNKIINSKNKKMIGWDEILEGGTVQDAAVMSWRGVKGGIEASHKKLPVVMSPAPIYYLDMNQGEPSIEVPIYDHARLRDVYAFDILAPGIDSAYVLGGQANLWTEQIPTRPQAEYMTYPRAFAVAEALWSPKAKRNWENFSSRLESHFQRFDRAGIHYSTAIYDPIIRVTKNNRGNLVIELTTEVSGLDLYFTLDNAWPTPYYPKYTEPIIVPEDVDIFRVVSYRNGKQAGKVITLKADELNKRVRK